jgi:hypothetical protein
MLISVRSFRFVPPRSPDQIFHTEAGGREEFSPPELALPQRFGCLNNRNLAPASRPPASLFNPIIAPARRRGVFEWRRVRAIRVRRASRCLRVRT